MQTPEEFAKELVDYISEEEYGAIAFAEKAIAARDAEWQARVDRATDEAVSQALKVVQASEDYRKLQARVEKLEAACREDLKVFEFIEGLCPGHWTSIPPRIRKLKRIVRTALGREA